MQPLSKHQSNQKAWSVYWHSIDSANFLLNDRRLFRMQAVFGILIIRSLVLFFIQIDGTEYSSAIVH